MFILLELIQVFFMMSLFCLPYKYNDSRSFYKNINSIQFKENKYTLTALAFLSFYEKVNYSLYQNRKLTRHA